MTQSRHTYSIDTPLALIGTDHSESPTRITVRVSARRGYRLLALRYLLNMNCRRFYGDFRTRFKVGDKLPVMRAFIGIVFDPQDVGWMDSRQHPAAIGQQNYAPADIIDCKRPSGDAPDC